MKATLTQPLWHYGTIIAEAEQVLEIMNHPAKARKSMQTSRAKERERGKGHARSLKVTQ